MLATDFAPALPSVQSALREHRQCGRVQFARNPRARLRLLWPLALAVLMAIVVAVLTVDTPRATPAVACADTSRQALLADWVADGSVDRAYAIPCYREAIDSLPEDLRSYSSAEEDILAALQLRVASL